MQKVNERESLEKFVVGILKDNPSNQEVYGYISRWSEDDPFWSLFLMRDDSKDGQLCGGYYPLNITDLADLTKVFTLFSSQERKIIVDTKKFFY